MIDIGSSPSPYSGDVARYRGEGEHQLSQSTMPDVRKVGLICINVHLRHKVGINPNNHTAKKEVVVYGARFHINFLAVLDCKLLGISRICMDVPLGSNQSIGVDSARSTTQPYDGRVLKVS
jgi:hypothetical protein